MPHAMFAQNSILSAAWFFLHNVVSNGVQCMGTPSAMHTYAALYVALCHILCHKTSCWQAAVQTCQQRVIADAQQAIHCLSYACLCPNKAVCLCNHSCTRESHLEQMSSQTDSSQRSDKSSSKTCLQGLTTPRTTGETGGSCCTQRQIWVSTLAVPSCLKRRCTNHLQTASPLWMC